VTGALVSLLVSLVSHDVTCCQQSHLAVFFAAYGATLSMTGRHLLSVFGIDYHSWLGLSRVFSLYSPQRLCWVESWSPFLWDSARHRLTLWDQQYWASALCSH